MPGSDDEPTPNLLDLPPFADDEDADDTLVFRAARRPRSLRLRRRWVIAVAAAGLLVVAAAAASAFALNRLRVVYATSAVHTGALAVTIAASGSVQGAVYDVDFSGGGRIATIDVSLGQQVDAGQRLATLDATSLQDAVNQAQTAVSAAQTALQDAYTGQSQVQAQTAAQLTAAYDQEQNALYACDHPPSGQSAAPDCAQLAQDQYNAVVAQADTQNATAQGEVDAAQAQVQAAEAALQTAQDNLANGTLTAPHAGTVAAINGTVGGTPGAGAAGNGGVFIAIVDLSTLQVAAAVDQANVGALAAGQHVVFSVGAYPGRTFQGTLQSISPLAQVQGGAVRYPVVITVDQQSLRGAHLFPGMTATTAVIIKQRFGVLLVPVGAVRYAQQAAAAAARGGGPLTPTRVRDALTLANQMLQQLDATADPGADDPTAGLLLERAGGGWVVKPVVLGLTDGRSYEVLAGLRAGERVVTAVGAPASGGATGRSAPPIAGPRPARV